MQNRTTEQIEATIARLEEEGKTEQVENLRRVLAQREPGYVREFKIQPVGEEEITDYRNAQDAYYPTMHLMEELKAETGKEYEMVIIAKGYMDNGKYITCEPYEKVSVRTDEYGIAVSPDSTDPIDVRRNYERTLPKEEQRQIAIDRMFNLKV